MRLEDKILRILFQKYKKSLQAKEWDPLVVTLQSFLDRILARIQGFELSYN